MDLHFAKEVAHFGSKKLFLRWFHNDSASYCVEEPENMLRHSKTHMLYKTWTGNKKRLVKWKSYLYDHLHHWFPVECTKLWLRSCPDLLFTAVSFHKLRNTQGKRHGTYLGNIYGIYKECIKNIHKSLWYKIIRNTGAAFGGRPIGSVFLIILYHKHLWIFFIHSLYIP